MLEIRKRCFLSCPALISDIQWERPQLRQCCTMGLLFITVNQKNVDSSWYIRDTWKHKRQSGNPELPFLFIYFFICVSFFHIFTSNKWSTLHVCVCVVILFKIKFEERLINSDYDYFNQAANSKMALQKNPYGTSMDPAWCWKRCEREKKRNWARVFFEYSLSLKCLLDNKELVLWAQPYVPSLRRPTMAEPKQNQLCRALLFQSAPPLCH